MIRIQQVGVDLAGSGRGTMAQCLADIVHGDPFGAGNAGKAVAEAVKGQRRKMVLRDEARKEFRHSDRLLFLIQHSGYAPNMGYIIGD